MLGWIKISVFSYITVITQAQTVTVSQTSNKWLCLNSLCLSEWNKIERSFPCIESTFSCVVVTKRIIYRGKYYLPGGRIPYFWRRLFTFILTIKYIFYVDWSGVTLKRRTFHVLEVLANRTKLSKRLTYLFLQIDRINK